jgi:CRISPR/Cas system CSM-associated protein Csm3 (group 7 of RAMP superfamily)
MKFQAITATLKLRTPLHVGTGRGTETADDLLRRDARGRLLIPGTALAGALRGIATRLAPRFTGIELCHALQEKREACGCLTCRLFGTVNPQDEVRGQHESQEAWLNRTGRATGVLIYDAVLEAADVQIRDGVGIDRTTGAAARRERIKFDLEVLPPGVEFKLRIELNRRLIDDAAFDAALQLLAATLAEWQAGRGVVGGRVARGLGAFDMSHVRFIKRDLDQADALMTFLRDGPPWDAKDDEDSAWIAAQVKSVGTVGEWQGNPELPVARSWALVEFTLAATGPFLTHDLTQAGRGGFDHAPVLAAYTPGAELPHGSGLRGVPVLPGSSLRGVLRSQAERIARTLATLDAWQQSTDPVQQRTAFLNGCPACNPLTTKTTDDVASCNSFIKALSKDKRDELARQGAEDKLCLACRLFGSTWNGSRLRVEDAPFKKGVKVEYKVMDFLAIDRFTGGGRDSAKFDALALWKPQFSVRLFLDNPEPWELGWLALTLRDLQDGLTTVGFGRAKGFGQCTLEDRKLTIGLLHDSDFPLPQASGDEQDKRTIEAASAAGERLLGVKGTSSGVFQTVAYDAGHQVDWLALANGWVKAFNAEVLARPRCDKFPLTADSYFKKVSDNYWLPVLYPVRVDR